MSENTASVIDRTIYPMPMFVTFQVADIAAAESFYHSVGFISLAVLGAPDGPPAVVHLRRMKYQDILLVPGEPERGSTTASFSAGGQDLTALAEALRADLPPGAAVEGPSDTPWFTSDLTVEDPDGNRVILTAYREAEADDAKEWVKDNMQSGDFVVEE
ncbi:MULTISPECIES: VOC family protein [Nocardiopsidaceae]|uniref:VOC family protein n=1 Tax=Streptomonospora nanhaiensis TaxID=1323731 RepID=A0ABY6YMI0_9ACTN|nr:VOC family protein [Streptomonospora nanhaiensis]WAE73495.1 VOC family protein [Streptomonospora nanhaiensis]